MKGGEAQGAPFQLSTLTDEAIQSGGAPGRTLRLNQSGQHATQRVALRGLGEGGRSRRTGLPPRDAPRREFVNCSFSRNGRKSPRKKTKTLDVSSRLHRP